MKILLIIVVLFIIFCIKESMTDDEAHKEFEQEGGLDMLFDYQYLGGFPDVAGGQKTSIYIYKTHLNFLVRPNYIEKNIYYKDVKSIEIQNEHELQRNISAGKVFMLGNLGFATNDMKTVVKNYIVIEYQDDDNKIRNVIIEGGQNTYNKLIKGLNYYKNNIKQNNNIENIG